jgi:hypothetical protein
MRWWRGHSSKGASDYIWRPILRQKLSYEIGHVLFIDIVGYSQLLITQQSERIGTLKRIVRGSAQFREAEAEGKVLRLPTGDGAALVFRTTPEAPVLCALEIARELKKYSELPVENENTQRTCQRDH